jgi:outer membrane protein TolC
VALALVFLLLHGCTPDKYRAKADKQVYELIQGKQRSVLNKDRPFTIERPSATLRNRLLGRLPGPAAGTPGSPAGETPTAGSSAVPEESVPVAATLDGTAVPAAARVPESVGPQVITLEEALLIAAENSREFQSQREDLYLVALDLTLAKHEFSSRFTAILSTGFTQTDSENRDFDGSGEGKLTRKLAQGGNLAASLGLTATKILSGQLDSSVISALDMELVQPLLRGAGRKVALEGLVQSERDLIYQVQTFARFCKDFAVEVISDYYSVLESRAVERNEEINYQNLVKSRQRAEALERAGRLPGIQLGQTQQNELRARDRWIVTQQQYQAAMDNFRVKLGLPTDAAIELDRRELDRLVASGPGDEPPRVAQAIEIALVKRLDHLVAKGKVEDAERKVDVAKDGLKADLDLTFTSGVESRRPNKVGDLRFKNGQYSAGLNLGLPLGRVEERNTFREAEVNLERSRRSLEASEDQVKLQVRSALRKLRRARESYGIQRSAVGLAQRRVDGANLLFEAGRAETRDLLEAQEALVQAQNSLIQALVDHTVAKLEFLRDTGQLEVNEQAVPIGL